MKKISLSEALERMEDCHRERSVQYPLHEILDFLRNEKSRGFTVKIADTSKQIEPQGEPFSAVAIAFG